MKRAWATAAILGVLFLGGAALAAGPRTMTTDAGSPPAGPARTAFPPGDYDFATLARTKGGEPVCREHWSVGADGVAVFESGAEVIRSTWTAEGGADGDWLVLSDRKGNGKPDCTGSVSKGAIAGRRIHYFVTNDGDVMVCGQPMRTNDGALIENCYALLTRRP